MDEPTLKQVACGVTVPEVIVTRGRERERVSIEVKRFHCDGFHPGYIVFHPVTGKRLSRVWRFPYTDTVRRGLTKIKPELIAALRERAPQRHVLLIAVPETLTDKAIARLALHVKLIARETPVLLPTTVQFVRCSCECFQ